MRTESVWSSIISTPHKGFRTINKRKRGRDFSHSYWDRKENSGFPRNKALLAPYLKHL